MTATEEPLRLSIDLTRREMYSATVGEMFRWLWILAAAPILGMVVIGIGVTTEIQVETRMAADLAYAALLWAFVMFGVPYWVAWSAFRRSRDLHSPIEYIFGSSGIEIRALTSAGRLDWTNVRKVRETSQFINLHMSSMVFYILPKRCFDSDQILTRFRELIRKNVNGKVKLRAA